MSIIFHSDTIKVKKTSLFITALTLIGASEAFANACGSLFEWASDARLLAQRYAELDREISKGLSGSLYDIQRNASPEQIEAWNTGLIESMKKLPAAAKRGERRPGLSESELRALFWRVKNDPLAAPNRILQKTYDPQNIGIGFCFGRALITQLAALRMGLAKESIRKVWVVGPIRSRDVNWQHHVATMVRDENGDWKVVDMLNREPVSLEAWFRGIKDNFETENIQLFVTDAKRFSPFDERAILPSTVKDPFYNGYFESLLRQSREAADELKRKKSGAQNCTLAGPPAGRSAWTCLKESFGIFN